MTNPKRKEFKDKKRKAYLSPGRTGGMVLSTFVATKGGKWKVVQRMRFDSNMKAAHAAKMWVSDGIRMK